LSFKVTHSDMVLEWTIVEKRGDTVRLNVTLLVDGEAHIYPPGVSFFEAEYRNVTYRRTLFFDVEVYSRESSLDGQPVGKTFFWAEPYHTSGEEVVISSPPSDQIVGEVWYAKTYNNLAVGKEVKIYGVHVCQRDPGCSASYMFSWYTGVVIEPTLLYPFVVPPESIGNFQITLRNGTVWNITRYAGEPVGTNLGLNDNITFELSETNVDIAVETTPESEAVDSGVWKYLPYSFVATFAVLATTFVIVRRRRKASQSSDKK